MKRNDDNAAGIIKIPDVSAVTASVTAHQSGLQQSVYVQRQPSAAHIEMSTRPSGASTGPAASGAAGSQISLPRAHAGGAPPGTTGVTVYRSDGPSNPPAAHSGGVAVTTTPSAVSSQQQPPLAHHPSSVVGQQPPPALKTEQITLPTTPVSLPYGTAVTTTYSGGAPPIKTLTQQPQRDQPNSVHPQIIHKPPTHQNFSGIRTVSLCMFFGFFSIFINILFRLQLGTFPIFPMW